MLWTYEHVVFQISHAKVATRVIADTVDAGEAAAVEADDGDVAAAAFCMQAIARGLRRRAVEDVFGRCDGSLASLASISSLASMASGCCCCPLWPQALQQIDACHNSSMG